jgi:hypothetical protein
MASEALAVSVALDFSDTIDPSDGEVIVTVGAVVSPPEMPPVGVGDGLGDGVGEGVGLGAGVGDGAGAGSLWMTMLVATIFQAHPETGSGRIFPS